VSDGVASPVTLESFSVKRHECSVFDKENWTCGDVMQKDGWISMTNGHFVASYDSEMIDHEVITYYVQVPVTWYWMQSVKNFL